jgi:ABC-2 type transport system permease protein
VLVMAAGQLAGGLAWLAISGEDAPDLVATAPIPAGFVIRAKTEAVIGSVALVFALFIAAMTLASPHDALMAALGIVVSAVSATMIQLWFRTQARRKHFRRRQTSSRVATFAEGVLVDHVGGNRGPGRGRPLAGGVHRDHRDWHSGCRSRGEPEKPVSAI